MWPTLLVSCLCVYLYIGPTFGQDKMYTPRNVFSVFKDMEIVPDVLDVAPSHELRVKHAL